MKYKFDQRSFWCRGYYIDTVDKNAKRIAEYVRNQLQEDMMYEQISIKEYKTRSTGIRNACVETAMNLEVLLVM